MLYFITKDAGHYHKDAGNEGPDQEYRLVEAMRLYARAVHVASQYRYEGVDSLALNKHTTSCAQLIAQDIVSARHNDKEPRTWNKETNAVAFASWLIAFADSLLFWEEQSDHKSFVEILNPSHKFFVGKLLSFLPHSTRQAAMELVLGGSGRNIEGHSKFRQGTVPGMLPHFQTPQSQRIINGLLGKALCEPKVKVRDMDLAMVSTAEVGEDGKRLKRRRCRR